MKITEMNEEEFATELSEQVRDGASVSDVMHLLDQRELKESFKDAAEPLIKYIAENHHPHTSAIVTSNRAELVEGLEVFNTDKYIKD